MAIFKEKISKAEFYRRWGIPKTHLPLRYVGVKGVYWYWFARYIRMRDFLKYGRCISCDNVKTFAELQGGHFAPAGTCGFLLLFDEQNVNGECGYCNAHDEGHLFGYEKGLDRRYGEGTAATLKHRYQMRMRPENIVKEWSKLEYERHAKEMQKKYHELCTQIPISAPKEVILS